MSEERWIRKRLDAHAAELTRELRASPRAAGHPAPEELVASVEWIPYGPTGADGEACEIAATLGSVEAEYGTIRKAAGLFEAPHRATLRVHGADRLDFLNRMLTQDVRGLQAGDVRASFWLNRKGRIEADLLLIERGDDLLIDVDVHRAEIARSTLEAFRFTEDVMIENVSTAWHRLLLHGRESMRLLGRAVGDETLMIDPGHHHVLSIAGVDVTAVRWDETGEPGFALLVPAAQVENVWEALLAAEVATGQGTRRARPIGWYAYNIARIEAGTPLFHVDFGPDNLPHETGVLHERVSFRKGCYLGQEIVARMESLGKPKQRLMGLRVTDDVLPVAGSEVFEKSEGGLGALVGVVTSSTLSPMLSAAPIAFAMIRTKFSEAGTEVLVASEGAQATALVQPLKFWSREANAAGVVT